LTVPKQHRSTVVLLGTSLTLVDVKHEDQPSQYSYTMPSPRFYIMTCPSELEAHTPPPREAGKNLQKRT
jgi:hypothetical protein